VSKVPTYNFPESYEIERIEALKIPRRTAKSVFFEIMPFDSMPETILIWEQKDVYRGFQQWRGLNGKPLTVARVNSKRFFAEPGYYGEKVVLREDELTRRRANASLAGAAGPIEIGDLVAEAHEQLLDRRLTLAIKIVSDLLFSGSFTVAGIDGNTVYQGSYTQQQFTPATSWSNTSASEPLQDMRTYRTYEYGQSVSFGNTGKNFQVMSIATINNLLANTNANDLGGKRSMYGSTLNSLTDLNRVLVDNEIPPIRVDTDGYFNSSGTFTRFVPDGKVLVVGHRDTGVRTGFYRFTRNLNSPNAAPQPYVRVKIDEDVPTNVEVHDGHNGGPVMQYPGALILVNVP
jgi:hypothetical protein